MILSPPAPVLTGWFTPFASAFTAPALRGVLILIAGAILAPGRRTITSVLSIRGLIDTTPGHDIPAQEDGDGAS